MKQLMRSIACVAFLICSMKVSSQNATTTTPAPGTSTGQKIGNAISAAITTAFPAVSTVIDKLFPKNADAKARTTKTDAETAVTTAHSAAVKTNQTNFDAIKGAATDLATIRTFLSYCITADEQIIKMQTILAAEPKPSTQSVKDLKYAWTTASENLKKLGDSALAARVMALTDPFVQTTLTNAAGANLGQIENITTQLNSSDWPNWEKSIADLQPKVSGVNNLSVILVGDISNALSQVPDVVAKSQDEIHVDGSDQRAEAVKKLGDLYPSVKTYPILSK
jgi:hypothetical protein